MIVVYSGLFDVGRIPISLESSYIVHCIEELPMV